MLRMRTRASGGVLSTVSAYSASVRVIAGDVLKIGRQHSLAIQLLAYGLIY